MTIPKHIGNILIYLSTFLKRHIDIICCFYLFSMFWLDVEYFIFYDRFYGIHEGEIKHYFDFSVAGWIFLFAHYKEMRSFGKIATIGFTGILAINSYQVHVNFNSRDYFIAWVVSMFILVFLIYCYHIAKYLNQYINPKY